jgi:hypothetical protein
LTLFLSCYFWEFSILYQVAKTPILSIEFTGSKAFK